MTTPIHFWSNDPTILFNKDYIFDLWPTTDMCYEEKLNSISRLIILLTLLGYIITFSLKILTIGIITLFAIFILYKVRKQKITKDFLNENFTVQGDTITDLGLNKKINSDSYINPITLETVLKTDFKDGTKKNPFSNVLLTQIMDDPERKSAPPCFNVDVDENITKNVKKTIQYLNPGIKNTNKQLFGSLWDNFELDQSNQRFYSTPNTRVTNDQSAYAYYLYGNMPSAKESTPEGNMQRYADNYRYTLY